MLSADRSDTMTAFTLQPGQASLPSKQSTHSYWHKEPSQILLGHRTTAELPQQADTVVVGSGITGSFAARELVSGGRDVLLLEAREACWGATGRNGGHCQPMIYMAKPHIARFELDTFNFLSDLVKDNGIQCSWEAPGGVHSITSAKMLSLVEKRLRQLQESHPDLASSVHLITNREELGKLRLRDEHAVAAVVQDFAAKCWPYKLVSWVLEGLLQHGEKAFNLQTTTPVVHLQRGRDSWIVHTERGQVSAKNVVLATNAYTSYLLPKLTGAITPTRGQVCALMPPEGSTPLDHTHVWSLEEKGDAGESDDYLIQRPSGELILGGERMVVAGGEETSKDDEINAKVGERLREAIHKSLNLSDSDPKKLEASWEWTGIMGYSADGSPWVGQVPGGLGGGDGLWISAAYTGHGMPVAARCGIAVAQRILGQTEGVVEVPAEWEVSEKRADGLKGLVMPQTIEEELAALVDGH